MSGKIWPWPANWSVVLQSTFKRDADLRQIEQEIREHNAQLRKLWKRKREIKNGLCPPRNAPPDINDSRTAN